MEANKVTSKVALTVTIREFPKARGKSIWVKGFYKVVKRQTFDGKQPGKRAFDNISLLLQGVDNYHYKWKHISHK